MPTNEGEREAEPRDADGSVESHILRFLRNNRPDAYNPEEIRQQLFDNLASPEGFIESVLVGLGEASLKQRIQEALDSLVEKGLVERKTIEEEYGIERDYYRFMD